MRNCGSLFQRTINPNTGNAETGCRIFRYRPSIGLLYSWTSRGAKTVFQIKNAIWRERCPRKNGMGVRVLFFPVMGAPSAKGWSDFRLHNRGVLGLFLCLLEAATIDHESKCFIEHPPAHTPSGLRADNPTHHKSSPTHPRADVLPSRHR